MSGVAGRPKKSRRRRRRRRLAASGGAVPRVTPIGGRVGRRRGRSFRQWANSPRVTGWLLIITAVVCAVFCIGNYRDAVTLRDHGVRTTATVLEVHDGKSNWVVLRFTTATGGKVTAEVANYDWQPTPRVGDRPTIVYDPSDPGGLVADARSGPDFLSAWLVGGCGVLAAALVWPTFTRRIDWSRWGR